MKNQSSKIIWNKRKSHSSSNANKDPYLFERVEVPVTDKDFFINQCNDTFDRIAENIKARMANGGKTTGLCELKEI